MDRGTLTLNPLGEEDVTAYRLPRNDLLEASSCQSWLVGIAPLHAYATKFMMLPVTKIAFLGDSVAHDYMDIITRPGHEERCCRSVLQFWK